MKGSNIKGAVIAIAAAGLFAGCAAKAPMVAAPADGPTTMEPSSGNACKGPNNCGGAEGEAAPESGSENSCKGANSCNS